MALNILIVDDSTAIRKILIRVLRQTKLPIGETFEARDGLEALAIVKEHPLNLVLSDINMPNMDGLALLAELKSSDLWRRLPVVMITTEGSEKKAWSSHPPRLRRLYPQAFHRGTDSRKNCRDSLSPAVPLVLVPGDPRPANILSVPGQILARHPAATIIIRYIGLVICLL